MILGICGSGGLGREVLELAHQINAIHNIWTQIFFVETDDYINLYGSLKKGLTVTTLEQLLTEYGTLNIEFIIAVGEPDLRRKICDDIVERGARLATLVHPSVHIPESTTIGSGSVVCYNSYISCDVSIGQNVYIQPQVNVGHDTVIDNNSVISGFVNIAGGCHIGMNTYVGLSVCIKENTTIGNDTIVGMGSVVIRDIPEGVTALGNPARPMKKNDEKKVFK